MPRILIIDDEKQIRLFLRVSLKAQGYEVIEAATAEEGLAALALHTPDLLILDLGLPDQDGQEALKALREWSQVPVIVLSVRSDEAGKVRALDAGANDYVTKPFGIQELLARIRNLTRPLHASAGEAVTKLQVGALQLDPLAHQVNLAGQNIKLTPKEFAVLKSLMTHPGRVFTQTFLLREHWGPTHTEDSQYLRVLIGRLRSKLGDDPTQPSLIATEPGVGYRLLIQDEI
ncbi:response regulator transcription factor [Marinospirillum sp. MEB164]|uniref:Response regulator transcription factor n=1 Tax=Marinospirillum alkalitolerans TaxID=3123374 RepID=A0ABW8PWP8_9GAMM